MFSCGVLPGSRRLIPSSVVRDQLLCFTGTIQACKRFLVKQTAHAVTACHLFQDTHHDLVVICCNINRCIDRRKLMLCRCNLIVLGLGCNSQLPALFIYFFHICGNSLTDGSEIMVIHLPVLFGGMAPKRVRPV